MRSNDKIYDGGPAFPNAEQRNADGVGIVESCAAMLAERSKARGEQP